MSVLERGFGRRPEELPVLVVPQAWVYGWPGATPGAGQYLPLQTVLTTPFETDAHFAQYAAPSQPFRLLANAYEQLAQPPLVHLVVFDVDSAEAHKTKQPATDAWFDNERSKLERLLEAHANGVIYRTRGGYRILYRVAHPFVVDSRDAELQWRLAYVRSGVRLAREFGIVIDPTCKSWAWLFRAPRATRDRALGSECREFIGDPSNVGTWAHGVV